MLRITREQLEDRMAVLHIEGRLVGPWVEYLREISENILLARLKLTVDLQNVSFADRAGVRLLVRLERQPSTTLCHCSPLIEQQMREESLIHG
jgi:anti-anti-sigma regulatory factor